MSFGLSEEKTIYTGSPLFKIHDSNIMIMKIIFVIH